MKFAAASVLFSLIAFALALVMSMPRTPWDLPILAFLAIIDAALFVLGRRDVSAMLDIAASEWEAAELRALMALTISFFALSALSLGYAILAHVAPSALG
ncbi:hypothetical protein [Thermoproteus tenax]|uniref:Uncharacterized protein n=1 Tax=Thermoproteus tenax (strain ATCC 35583 / DSM 2078 / JCM 9277 / NBRC 100435 / Kra 1) TaxID=768679 RepID=G4RQ36_THETK|nr:hypothetical protein [Thermoproteus tenax]CCC81682.1 hypothetical protein TTX_1037 [Thermoproteus tenax Kra 1]